MAPRLSLLFSNFSITCITYNTLILQAFCLAFGSLLLLCGKIHFNYIYGIGVLGCLAIYGLLTLMANTQVSFCVVVSVLVSFLPIRWYGTTDVAFLLITHFTRVQYSAFPKFYFDVAEIFRRLWLKEI